jgi:hypothetical protein
MASTTSRRRSPSASFAQGVARWKNSAEAGEQKLADPAFYLSTQGLPEELGWLAHALLKAPGQRMALLPRAKRASSARRAERRRRREQAARDRVSDRRARLLAEHGVADDDQSFFASVDRFYSVVRAGFESSVPKLLEKQEALERAALWSSRAR